jgi:hypothetical protein
VGKKGVSFEEKMYDFIIKYYHVPIHSILRSTSWLNSSFRFLRSNNPIFQTVTDTITLLWTLLQDRKTCPGHPVLQETVLGWII